MLACFLWLYRHGAAILQDLALLSLEDPGNPGQLQLGSVKPVDFHEVARKEHTWQVLSIAPFWACPWACVQPPFDFL